MLFERSPKECPPDVRLLPDQCCGPLPLLRHARRNLAIEQSPGRRRYVPGNLFRVNVAGHLSRIVKSVMDSGWCVRERWVGYGPPYGGLLAYCEPVSVDSRPLIHDVSGLGPDARDGAGRLSPRLRPVRTASSARVGAFGRGGSGTTHPTDSGW